jgi:hypothetical protein
MKLFPWREGMRQWYPLSPHFFNIVLEFLARATRQKREIQWIQIGNKDFKLMIVFLKGPPRTLKSNKHFWQSSRIQNQHKKSIVFLYANNRL